MPIPTVEEAFANMEKVSGDRVLEGFTRRSAELNAAAQYYSAQQLLGAAQLVRQAVDGVSEMQANTITATSHAMKLLRESIGVLTEASNGNTEVIGKWTRQTADATRGLKWATWALFVAMVVQIAVMWFGR